MKKVKIYFSYKKLRESKKWIKEKINKIKNK
jgi:hypothetical protein